MNVVLVHKDHGAKVAINEQEIEQDMKNGWTRYNEPEQKELPQDESIERVKRKYTRRTDNE